MVYSHNLIRRLFFLIAFGLAATSVTSQSRLWFSPNLGQWDDPSLAHCAFKGGAFFLNKTGFRLKMYHRDDLPNTHKAFHFRDRDTQFLVRGHALDVTFAGANPNPVVDFLEEADFYENYFLGSDESRWKTAVYPSGRIKLRNVYPGIDFVVYSIGETLEYDWLIQPDANPNLIKMVIQGAEAYRMDETGTCFVKTSVGDFQFNRPRAWQQDGNQMPVLSSYKLRGDTLLVNVGTYNKKSPLIIDPVLIFSTYSGSHGDNFGFTATYDSSGHLYAGGIVDIQQGTYPITTGAFQTKYGGRGPAAAPVYLPCDVSISKYKPDGSALVYASYLGGSSNEYPHSLGFDENNDLLIFGTTLSTNFPVVKKTAFDTSQNGRHDLFVAKVSADGTTLKACTYLGGNLDDGINTGNLHFNYADDFRGDIISDVYGNIYLTTCARSTNFPISAFANQKTLSAGLESVIVSLDANLSTLRWSTYFGGTGDDAGYSIKMDDSEHIFVSGGTASASIPIVGKSLHNTFQGGKSDGFVLKLSSDSGHFLTSTYWGTNSYEQAYFLDLDNNNKIYITGQTEGSINRTNGTYGKNGTTQFIARLSNNLDSQEIVTTFGNRSSSPELSPCAFMVDKCYNIYFSGWGSAIGTSGTTDGLEITPDAIQKTTDKNDFYLIVLGKDMKSLLYATYFGGDSSEDHVDGGTSRFDKRGIIYQSVCSSCPNNPPGLNDFPTTSGAAFPVNVSYRCSNASFKLDFKITYAVEARFTAKPQVSCMPDTIRFFQTSVHGKSWLWDFGDGIKSSDYNPVHSYNNPGVYKVKLTVTDTGSCNKVDSMFMNITILLKPDVKLTIDGEPCNPEMTLKLTGKEFGNATWDLGDKTTAAGNSVKHTYGQGSYTVKVYVVNPTSGCKDSIKTTVTIRQDSLNSIFLANVFTPNSDSKNDCFRVYGITKDCTDAELKIFNRWGELLFETKDLSQCWDGTVQNDGAQLPEGTYFYQLFLKNISSGQKRLISGSINLMR